ncbi:MAG: UDP-N-acetylmuramoyl-tripeptide--D-alanyl-D-alanine ligase [Treponema sp.]|jgi:UDP-N-acetylmuramoyl-tripeptide--D-alanyl-D-alanine ligase|nr:UDP-N-acetylmuramoyl-tripeptide--D-alanyl-D-alanine ligase [Treponema sp.]
MGKSILMDFDSLSKGIGAKLVFFSTHQANLAEGFSSVSIDSRDVKPGALFVALSGTVSDGHRFVGAAFDAGAVAVMVADSAYQSNVFGIKEAAEKAGGILIVVNNTLKALQDSARIYLEQFPKLLKVGITGSSGKTTTKEIAAAIISQEKKVVMNPGNYNSETGLPLAVFNVRDEHEVGIFEMGMNRCGEISELAAILKPHIALITNIGTAHIGMIGTKEGIAEEKKSIFSQFTGNEIALVPEGDEYASYLLEGVQGEAKLFGPSSMKNLEGYNDLGVEGTELIWEGSRIRFALPGHYNVLNALAGIAIALAVPVSTDAIKHGLESVKPLFGRGEIIKGDVTVLRDCYNANLEAVLSAIDFSDSLEWNGRKIYVIGSMLELGDASESFHEKVGEALAASKAEKVFLFGKETLPAVKVLETSKNVSVFYTDEMEMLSKAVSEYAEPGDFVLLKGSRGTALEKLTDVFVKK